MNSAYFPRGGHRWRSGRNSGRRSRYAFPQRLSRHRKGHKLLMFLVLLLLIAVGLFSWEIIRTYGGEKAWHEALQPAIDGEDGN